MTGKDEVAVEVSSEDGGEEELQSGGEADDKMREKRVVREVIPNTRIQNMKI